MNGIRLEITCVFSEADPLKRIIVHLCNQFALLSADPVTNTLRMMITTPVEPILTEMGIVLFKEQMYHVYPYNKMNKVIFLYI